MTAYDPRIEKLENDIRPWRTIDLKTGVVKLQDNAPTDIVEKDKLCQKLYEELINGFPIGCQ